MDAQSLLRIISEPTKYGILVALRDAPTDVSTLVEQLQLEQSNVSHHLRMLRDAGLVSNRREGRHQIYTLSHPDVGQILLRVETLANRLDQVAYTAAVGLPGDSSFHGYG